MSVSQTTRLTAMFAAGMLLAMALSARYLGRSGDPIRLAGYGAVVGVFAFAAVIIAGAVGSLTLFATGTLLIGVGNGLFAVGTLTATMLLSGTSAGHRNREAERRTTHACGPEKDQLRRTPGH